ncbi:helix-turn-helix domain-containing protein [Paracraurococcus sp. LOR1-02]|uniref:Helix-turn-helix domain-containing protein n=2 Tax=Paracraurococcus lichenis TaxID=3064888 RepID=A0ABT9ECR3_9PROT|nr:helix-turn-helix domain-containing protein [Paracraurococcus sp. LOR1-02]MDO9714003.1 helix-turn-helix domain-containing protein [Paracraurococcus sp. LOR1-02]
MTQCRHSRETETPTQPAVLDRRVAAAWCRGARQLLGWSTERLAVMAGISTSMLRQIERAEQSAPASSVARILAVVQDAGVTLSGDDRTAWVSLRQPPPDSDMIKLSILCDVGVAMLGWSSDRLMQEARQHGAELRRRQRTRTRAQRAPQEVAAVRAAVQAAGIVFDAEGGMGVGVWLTEEDDAGGSGGLRDERDRNRR